MSPARVPLSGPDRARILRRLVDDAKGCKIGLTAEEVETLEDVIPLYDDGEEGATST